MQEDSQLALLYMLTFIIYTNTMLGYHSVHIDFLPDMCKDIKDGVCYGCGNVILFNVVLIAPVSTTQEKTH